MEEMEVAARDHYRVLGLPSGEEGSKHNEKQITKAYRVKALQLHPDKRPNDPNAKAMFQNLGLSYAILMNPEDRKRFHSFLKGLEKKKKEDPAENVLFAFGHLIFAFGPMFLPAFPGATTGAGFVIRGLCFKIAFEELCRRQKLEKLCSMMARVGDYLKRYLPQTAIIQEFIESIYLVLASFRAN